MKNVIYKLIPIFSLCVCMLWCLSITVFALVPDPNYTEVLKAEFELGDTAYYYAREEYTTSKEQLYTYVIENSFVISDSNKYMCFYLVEDSRASSGYTLKVFENSVGGSYNKIYVDGEYSRTSTSMSSASSIAPNIYRIDTDRTTTAFHTNIPIFPTLELAEQYAQGLIGVDSAVNYKKEVSDTGWVKPFEDIEINDSEIPVPELCNLSHSSFSVSNNTDEKYLVEVYLESGLQNPYYILNGSDRFSIEDPYYLNSFGLITDNSEAYWSGPDFDILGLWSVDNESALLSSVNSFYTRFSTAMSWYTADDIQNVGIMSHFDKDAYAIWGQPFGDKYGIWGNISKITAEDLAAVDIDDVGICFTHYLVRYWYYDDDSGYHYGPWTSVVYFSNGNVSVKSIFQDDDGNILESSTETGKQDSDGSLNVSSDDVFIDLGSSDNLFAYINSLFTNLKYVAGNFSIVFGSVFSFLPADIRNMIYLGMGCIIVIGIIKALRG